MTTHFFNLECKKKKNSWISPNTGACLSCSFVTLKFIKLMWSHTNLTQSLSRHTNIIHKLCASLDHTRNTSITNYSRNNSLWCIVGRIRQIGCRTIAAFVMRERPVCKPNLSNGTRDGSLTPPLSLRGSNLIAFRCQLHCCGVNTDFPRGKFLNDIERQGGQQHHAPRKDRGQHWCGVIAICRGTN